MLQINQLQVEGIDLAKLESSLSILFLWPQKQFSNKEFTGFNIEYVLREEPYTDPYARFCGQTEAAASPDPITAIYPYAL